MTHCLGGQGPENNAPAQSLTQCPGDQGPENNATAQFLTHCPGDQGPENKVERGKVEEWLSKCDHVLEGSVVVGSQEHFYLEPQVSVVEPQENDELIIHASTQVLDCPDYYVVTRLT